MSGVVIGVGAAVGAVAFGGNSIYGMNKQNRNTLAAFKKQMKYLQTNYNYNQAALDRQERSMYDNALGELFTLSLNAYQNNAQVEAAIAETGLEGRSQEKIEQTVRGQTARQETATKEAYMMDVWNVRSQRMLFTSRLRHQLSRLGITLIMNLSTVLKLSSGSLGVLSKVRLLVRLQQVLLVRPQVP